jgi:transposase-like protein
LGTDSDNVTDMRDKGRNPTYKLDGGKASLARQMYAEGYSFRAIARKFKIDPSTAMEAARGITWT